MAFETARGRSLALTLARASACLTMAGVFLFAGSNSLQTAIAEGDTRTLSFHHLHTGENITITYKRNGRYDDAALKKLDWFMRDWRKDQSTRMDPHLFDLLWETYREVGATQPIDVVCGYRSPATNSMLRARSSGVAKNSNHIGGQAMDFFIPGVPLEKIREVGLRLQRGGVGFYPTSGSPFVHLDTGTVRHWPRMTHDQLAKIFPDGRTVHIPSDGQPLRGYALALADIERRGDRPSESSLQSARDAGIVTGNIEHVSQKPVRDFFARLFGSKDEHEQNEEAASKGTRAPVVVASAKSLRTTHVAASRVVPLPAARPKTIELVAAAKPAQRTITVASLGSNLFDKRGYWRGAVEADPNVTAAATIYQTAAAETSGAATRALAYAAETADPPAVARARPMGSSVPQIAEQATILPGDGNSTIAVKPAAAESVSAQQAFQGPWLRAAMLTPSVSSYMTVTQLGPSNMQSLQNLLHKPSMSIAMSFSADPNSVIALGQFSGPAVVFLAATTFALQTTASLR